MLQDTRLECMLLDPDELTSIHPKSGMTQEQTL
jgi:hypothetical protein